MSKKTGNPYELLFETVHEGAFIGTVSPFDGHAGITVAANPYLKRIFGYAADAPAADVQPFARERFGEASARKAFLDRLTGQGRVTDYLLRMRRLDDSPVWVEVTAHAQSSEVVGEIRVEALVRDVSERKRLDDQSRDVHQQLLQADKMAALGQTISGVAHELNNPLATILSWAERLVERRLDDSSRKGAEVILAEADRAARIVRNLLTFARKRQSTRAMVDINQIVRETLALRAHDHRMTNIEVTQQLASDLPPVFADTHQIQQVLLNLIINAEQAMRVSRDASLLLRTSHDVAGESVVIEVQDSGPGVPQDVRSKIFDPFFTTKEVGQGTGLGLAVAYAIVQEHGGRIELESPADGGALFRLDLPVSGVQGAAKRAARSSGTPSMEAVRGAAVLVVEDEQALAAAVIEALGDAGLKVHYAADGEQALARLQSNRYDLVICDLKMPRVDGMSLYRSMIAGNRAVPPIIFVTGDVAGTEAEAFLEESGCRWLAKPFRLAELLRAVREVLT